MGQSLHEEDEYEKAEAEARQACHEAARRVGGAATELYDAIAAVVRAERLREIAEAAREKHTEEIWGR